MHFLLPPLILRLYTGCRLDQTLSKCIASYKKSKSAKMLRIGMIFISQPYRIPSAHAYEIHLKLWRFSVIKKMKLVSFSLFLDASPPPPPP